jgi:CheY-like chemotaxis protein
MFVVDFMFVVVSNTIVKLHNGRIGVVSHGEGHGSTFYIDIPISKIEKGSNYKHVSPIRKDNSSKSKYTPENSPLRLKGVVNGVGRSSPNSNSVSSPKTSHKSSPKHHQHHHSSPKHHVQGNAASAPTGSTGSPVFNPNRNFISPSTSIASVTAGSLSGMVENGGSFNLPGQCVDNSQRSVPPPLHTASNSSRAGTMVLHGSGDDAPGVTGELEEGSYLRQIHAAAGGGLYVPPRIEKAPSDLSFFTSGSSRKGSSRSSHCTINSSFSTDADGLSTRSNPSHKPLNPTTVSSSLLSAVHQVQADKTHGHSANSIGNISSIAEAGLLLDQGGGNKEQIQINKNSKLHPLQQGESRSSRTWGLFEKRALIVDDSPTNRKFVNRLLRTKIGTRDEAVDGQEAVNMVSAAIQAGISYDLILMDYVMPVMDGPTATQKIRDMGYKGVILGVTGNGHQPEIDLFLNSGADQVLIKPLSADKFYDIIYGKTYVEIILILYIIFYP